jgi:hypothetical protein
VTEELLKGIFQETIEAIEMAGENKSIVDKILDEFAGKILNLPDEDIFKEVRVFVAFAKEQEREIKRLLEHLLEHQMLVLDIKGDEHLSEATQKLSEEIKRQKELIARLEAYKFWFIREAPKSIPNKIILAATGLIDRVVDEINSLMTQTKAAVGLGGLAGLLDLFGDLLKK